MKHRAAVLTDVGRIEIVNDRTLPAPAGSELLVRVEATGLCGSDMAVYLGRHAYKRPPVVLGHEFSGTVVALGAAVSRLQVGDRVCAASFSPCGRCEACASGDIPCCAAKRNLCHAGWDGSFADHVIVSENMTHRLPPGMDAHRGALVEPLTIALHAMRKADAIAGRRVTILGAGSIGLGCLILARHLGARTVRCIDRGDVKRDQALRLGADDYVDARDPSALDAAGQAAVSGADLVVIASGHPTAFAQACSLVKPGGEVVFVAYGDPVEDFPVNGFLRAEIAVKFSYLSTDADFEEVIRWIASGDIDPLPLVTHRLPFEGIPRGVALKHARADEVGKVLFSF